MKSAHVQKLIPTLVSMGKLRSNKMVTVGYILNHDQPFKKHFGILRYSRNLEQHENYQSSHLLLCFLSKEKKKRKKSRNRSISFFLFLLESVRYILAAPAPYCIRSASIFRRTKNMHTYKTEKSRLKQNSNK